MLGLEITHGAAAGPRAILDASTVPIASENTRVIRTLLSLDKSGATAIDDTEGKTVSMVIVRGLEAAEEMPA